MESNVRRLFEDGPHEALANDIVLPAQYWADGSDPRTEPEKRLMVAVLEEAVATLVNTSGDPSTAARQLAIEARHWIESDDRSGPFSFGTICDVLALDPSSVRRAVARRLAERRPYARRRRIQAGRGRHRVRSVERERRVA